jgi:TatD DNase family protein
MNLQLIDTHCHLYVDAFRADIDTVVQRAHSQGVTHMLLPAIDSTELQHLLDLEQAWPQACLPMMGLHPCSVKADYKDELSLVEEWLFKRTFWGVGEIGLDYYWDKTFVAEQQEAFSQQIEWAKKLDLPIAIHSRNAIADCIRIVAAQQDGSLRGVFHCFSDSEAEAKQIIELGFYLGIGGVLTYKNSGLANAIRNISLDHMILETDAPYLTPVPFRGKRNESSYIKYIAAKLAEVKESGIEEVAAITTANAKSLFRLTDK